MSNNKVVVIGTVVVVGTLVAVFSLVWAGPFGSGSDQVTQARPASFEHPAVIVQQTQTFPDPYIVWDPATHLYRLFATDTLWSNVPQYTSKTETGPWTFVGDALPVRPTWVKPGFDMWAPEVDDINGTWTMWGSAKLVQSPRVNCLYRATAKTAAGPYTVDPRTQCYDLALDGDIDPSMSESKGHWSLIYKINANTYGKPTSFESVALGLNGLPVGPHRQVLKADQAWEAGMVEAPSMVLNQSSGKWWLVFSAGNFSNLDPSYEIVAAPCQAVGGPCNIDDVVDLVSTNKQGKGPGEESVSIDRHGQAWIPYNPSGPFRNPALRVLALVKLDFNLQGVPYVVTP